MWHDTLTIIYTGLANILDIDMYMYIMIMKTAFFIQCKYIYLDYLNSFTDKGHNVMSLCVYVPQRVCLLKMFVW